MGSTRVLPVVGMEATIRHYAVSEAATVVAVEDAGRRVTVRSETEGRVLVFSLRATGKFVRVGESTNGGTRLVLGGQPR